MRKRYITIEPIVADEPAWDSDRAIYFADEVDQRISELEAERDYIYSVAIESKVLDTLITNCESRIRQAVTHVIRHQSQDAYNDALSDMTELKRLCELKKECES